MAQRKHRRSPLQRRQQRGVAALAVALSIIVIATVVTVGVAQIGVSDQKGMANEFRSRQASSIAELALDRATLFLRQNKALVTSTAPAVLGPPAVAAGWMNADSPNVPRWSACTDTEVDIPCGDGKVNLFDSNWTKTSNIQTFNPANPLTPSGEDLTTTLGKFKAYYVARAATAGGAAPASNSVIYVVATGQSADAAGQALVRKAVVFYPALARRPDAPLIAAGVMSISGAMSVVANPNGGGEGVPLSAWAKEDISMGVGGMQTCHNSEYYSYDSDYTYQTDPDTGKTLTLCPDCRCPNTTDKQISYSGQEDLDILDDENTVGAVDTATSSTNVNPDSSYFPPDLFEYAFGIPEANYQQKKDEARLITDCGTLGPASSGLLWIVGDCAIPSNTIVGSFAAPVILVIEDGDFRMNAGSTFIGLVFVFQRTPGTYGVTVNGSPTLVGALLSNENLDLGNGAYRVRYDKDVLDNLAKGGTNAPGSLAEVPGTWTNYQAP